MNQNQIDELYERCFEKDMDEGYDLFCEEVEKMRGTMASLDWKEFSESAFRSLQKALAKIDVQLLEDPESRYSDSFGMIFFNRRG